MTGDYIKLLEIVTEPIQSTNIAAIGFDKVHSIIHIEFKSGGAYRYLECDQELYDGLANARSVGRFFHVKIRDIKPFVKVA